MYCREGYASLEEVTELASAYAVKHSSARWFSFKTVLVRIFNSGTTYFSNLSFDPRQTKFNHEIKEML